MSETNHLSFKVLKAAVEGSACALRCRTTLQPAGGEGDKVFPPTYAGAVYAKEQRKVHGREEPVDCVLLDSVQSQANRMEEALQAAVDEGRMKIPVIEVDFSGTDLLTAIGKVTSLQAPHRIADAILRDSLLVDKPFRQTDEGRNLDTASLTNATGIYALCPTALVFGLWDSTGPKGGMGAKFQRAMVSEIVGINAVYGVKTSSRIDPLQIVKNAGPLYHNKNAGKGDIDWTLDTNQATTSNGEPQKFNRGGDATQSKPGDPSKANHSNYPPSVSDGSVTIASAEQVTTLSLPALRRLHFPVNGKVSQEVNAAGRTVLAALGLCAAALAGEKGFDLRSRCLLWPSGAMEWELLDRPGQTPARLTLQAKAAIALMDEAVAVAEKLGLRWRTEPLVLKPAPQLVSLVEKSQKLAAASGEDKGDE